MKYERRRIEIERERERERERKRERERERERKRERERERERESGCIPPRITHPIFLSCILPLLLNSFDALCPAFSFLNSTPQFAVFYSGRECLGSAVIASVD